jgi:hypothetical protein
MSTDQSRSKVGRSCRCSDPLSFLGPTTPGVCPFRVITDFLGSGGLAWLVSVGVHRDASMAVHQSSRVQALCLCFVTACLAFGVDVAWGQAPAQRANDQEHASRQGSGRVRTARDARVPPMPRRRPPEQHTRQSAAGTASQSTSVSSVNASPVAAASTTKQATGPDGAGGALPRPEKAQSPPGRAGLGASGVPAAADAPGSAANP